MYIYTSNRKSTTALYSLPSAEKFIFVTDIAFLLLFRQNKNIVY